MKCEKCGTEYEGNFCPKGCNSPYTNQPTPPQKKKKGKAGKMVLGILGVFVVLAIIGNLLGDDSSTTDTGSDETNVSSVSAEDNNSQTKKEDEPLIYSDDYVKVKFVKIEDAQKATGLTACYIYLDVENVSSQKYTVTLSEAYANDSQVTMMSGLPMTLEAGKKSRQPFMFGYNNILTSADDIEKLEFKIALLNEDMNGFLETTKTITVNVK